MARGAVLPDVQDRPARPADVVFTALAVSREVQARTGLAIRNVTRQLRPLRSATIAINATAQTFAPEIPTDKQHILDALRNGKVTH